MKTTLRKVYQCEHCNRNMLSAGAMSRHEKFCTQNPNNWHKCFDYCDHLIKTKEKVCGMGDEGGSWKTIFTCSVLNKQLYSFKLEKSYPQFIGNLERMPLQCDSYLNSEKESDDIYDL
jgi:hypothetical protein